MTNLMFAANASKLTHEVVIPSLDWARFFIVKFGFTHLLFVFYMGDQAKFL